jgi:hypothetical protein
VVYRKDKRMRECKKERKRGRDEGEKGERGGK